jgi:hypothetical protein
MQSNAQAANKPERAGGEYQISLFLGIANIGLHGILKAAWT